MLRKKLPEDGHKRWPKQLGDLQCLEYNPRIFTCTAWFYFHSNLMEHAAGGTFV
jgi:hypothetical protein